jgi:hypothetical protein
MRQQQYFIDYNQYKLVLVSRFQTYHDILVVEKVARNSQEVLMTTFSWDSDYVDLLQQHQKIVVDKRGIRS